MLYGRDGQQFSCKAYGESLLHSKKQVEHERLRLAKTVGRLTNTSFPVTKERKATANPPLLQLYRWPSQSSNALPLQAHPAKWSIIAYQHLFSHSSPGPWRGIVIYQTLLSACAFALARALIYHEGSGHLVPRPRPSTRERGSGNFSRFSWHFLSLVAQPLLYKRMRASA